MALTPGTRLGPYEILSALGAGGMGEVYRATDTKLKRQVAIKILPPALSAAADRLARFQREAEVLAALNHPNIAAIYGLEENGGTLALVMELVEGEDLANRIARGPIPIDEALPIAKQIAEALEAAHEQGIIHRDLKPANIKVRADGTVKVLDFGLAKALEPTAVGSPSASTSPTLTSPAMTQAGMILGTAAYMAPEQARGGSVDKRADIWAFGVVLFEMLTGTRLFEGATVSDTLAFVLTKDPVWTTLPTQTPAPIRRVLRRALEKDRKRRLTDAGAARLEIDEALAAPAVEPTQTSTASRAVSNRLPWMLLAVAAAVIIALTVPTVRHLRETPPTPPPEARVDLVIPGTTEPASFALAPDGRSIVFVASGDGPPRLWLRSLGSAISAQVLPGTEGATYPFWAPDSRSVGFFAGNQLKRLDLGGSLRTLATAQGARGGTWSTDGTIVFAGAATGGLSRVSAGGSATATATELSDGQTSHRFPSFLPDGRHFLLYVQGSPDRIGIYLGGLDDTKPTRLTAAEAAAVFLPSGWVSWMRGDLLVAQHLDLEGRTLTGDAVALADGVTVEGMFNAAAVSVSANGTVAYQANSLGRRQLQWRDRTGQSLGTLGDPDYSGILFPSLSPDGRRVAVSRSVRGNVDVWLLDDARSSRFTFDSGRDLFPLWSSDGGRVVFDSNRGGQRNLYVKDANGATEESVLVKSAYPKYASDWSRDGQYLLFTTNGSPTRADIWIQPMAGHSPAWPFLKRDAADAWGRFSPDGHFIAFQSDQSGQFEIYVRPVGTPATRALATAASQWQLSTTGGVFPSWRADGRELYFLTPDGDMMAVPLARHGDLLDPGAPVRLFRARTIGGGTDVGQGRPYDVSADGRFLIDTSLDQGATTPITLLMNWHPDAKR